MLKVTDLSKTYIGVGTLFENLSFSLGNKEKVGLVGFNGCGKTTLLKIIAGIEDHDKGEIDLDNDYVCYLPQEITFPDETYVGEFLESLVTDIYSEMYIVDYWLNIFGLSEIDQYMLLENLSEGQKMKIYLISMLVDKNAPSVRKSPILLLDEPTNHLDIEGIKWFEDFVEKYKGICIIISHDRSFLNNTVTKIFEIDEQRLNVFEGNYDDYILGKERWLEDRTKRYRMQELHRDKLDRLIKRFRKQGNSAGLKAAKKRMEREVLKNEISEYKSHEIRSIDISGDLHAKKRVLNAKDVSFGYGDEDIIHNSSFKIWGRDKIWLYGANGSGKTTLIKLITGDLQPRKGTLTLADNLEFSYFSQDQSHLDKDEKVADFFMNASGVTYERSFGALDHFLFDKSFRDNRIRELSPGQRARLSFAIFAQQEYDMMILDEPTNHLDIRTKELIEQAVRDFKGAVIFISHDRYFVDEIGPNRTFTLEKGRLVETYGSN